MTVIRRDVLLFLIAVFTGYLVLTGLAARRKTGGRAYRGTLRSAAYFRTDAGRWHNRGSHRVQRAQCPDRIRIGSL